MLCETLYDPLSRMLLKGDTCWDSVRFPGVDDSNRDQPLLTPRRKIKNGRAHAVCRPGA